MDVLASYNAKLETMTAKEVLTFLVDEFGDKLVLASSLGAEDQALTHLMIEVNPKARIFVLDTGRLNQETYDLMQETMTHYGFQYEVYFPEATNVQSMVAEKGPNLFYESIENRLKCCHLRKVEPLKRALTECEAWITGLRRAQSVTRAQLPCIEFDKTHGCYKVNPLYLWTEEDVWAYIKMHNIPYNKLHDQGYPSIGCAPCTRAIEPGEDLRAGRWWWETPDQKECGLHMVDGKLVPNRQQKEETENG